VLHGKVEHRVDGNYLKRRCGDRAKCHPRRRQLRFNSIRWSFFTDDGVDLAQVSHRNFSAES
jgi:hypothetical protein